MLDAALHPLVIVSIVVLMVNDHFLKEQYPSLLTGKLSDVAGLIFFPVVVFSLFELTQRWQRKPLPSFRVAVVICLTCGVGFALVKTVPAINAAYCQVLAGLRWPFRAGSALWSGEPVPGLERVIVLRDATDLWTVAAVVVAMLILRGVTGRPRDATPAGVGLSRT